MLPTSQNKIVCITGMHRSGTSLVTSWLERCGLSIHNGSVMGAAICNPKGHFEDMDFFNIHQSELMALNPRTVGWKICMDRDLRFSATSLEKAKRLINDRNAKYRYWGWKDPRSIFFFQQWKSLIPDLKGLFIWRPCAEVVHSLIKRSGAVNKRNIARINALQSLKLWLSSNKRVCALKEQYPSDILLFSVDWILSHDNDALALINERFKTDLTHFPIQKIYEEDLMHNKVPWFIKGISICSEALLLEKKLLALSDGHCQGKSRD